MSLKYSASYFIDKFEKIPEERWTTGMLTDVYQNVERHCAHGHCGTRGGSMNREVTTIESIALSGLFSLLSGMDRDLYRGWGRGFDSSALAAAAVNDAMN